MKNKKIKKSLDSFESLIGYNFLKRSFLEKAMTHPGMGKKSGYEFERLEFLGDRVLGLVVASFLYENHTKEKEGLLARRLAKLVCKEKLLEVAEEIDLSSYIKARKGDLLPNSGILSDAVEALIGAIYLDNGIGGCNDFINKFWQDSFSNQSSSKDYKSILQEIVQKKTNGRVSPIYSVISIDGPAHTPLFKVKVVAESFGEECGSGINKKQAEQMAADLLIKKIKNKGK